MSEKDTIYRQDAIDVLAEMQGRCTSKEALIQNSKIWQQIKDLPSADRTGHWIDTYGMEWICSNCGVETHFDEDYRVDDVRAHQMHYCHYCGAKMGWKK